MLIELHTVTDNERVWVNPTKIMLVTFQEGAATLMMEGGIAMQVIENRAEMRTLLDRVAGASSIIVGQVN